MKKVMFLVMVAFMTLFAACGGSKFDDAKAKELVDKYKEDPSKITEDDAKAVAELVVNYFDDYTTFVNDNKGEKDEKKLAEASKKFDEAHKNAAELVSLYYQVEDKVPADSKKAVEEAKKKRDEAVKAAAEGK